MKNSERVRNHQLRWQWLMTGLILLVAAPLWSQADNPPPVAAMVGFDHSSTPPENNVCDAPDDRMLTPPPVSREPFAMVPSSEERFNYLRYGLSFTSSYTDNALGPTDGHPVSDVGNTVFPVVALDASNTRSHWQLTYAPGFTFYQRASELNQADQNAVVAGQYRLSPHVTLEARDVFQKSSSVFNQPDFGLAGTVSGGTVGTNGSVIAPIADRLSNTGNAGITYQFSRNSMVGMSGAFSNLHFPTPAQVPGLYDGAAQTGAAFYAFRAGSHYLGAVYEYQRLMAYPAEGVSETQTQAAFLFYSFHPAPGLSVSFFGGPQYARTLQPAQSPLRQAPPELQGWTPAGGASLNWQGRLSSFALAYLHHIGESGGLMGAVRMDSATVSFGRQITRDLSASLNGGYVQNNVIGTAQLGIADGHTIFGTVSVLQQLGPHLSLQLGYTRLRQDYADVPVLSSTPNTNREFVSLSYQFSRPLGR